MPTYEYKCTKCERLFEVFQPITASAKRHLETDCKQCNNRAPVRRCIGTGGGIIFKGSGFYQTDYRSEGYKKSAEAEKKSGEEKSSGDSKSDQKTEKKKEPKSTKKESTAPKD